MKARNLKVIGAAVVVAALGSVGAAQMSGQGPDQGPLEVGVMEMTLHDVPQVSTLPGRAVAFQEVELRPRVGGVIEEILYTPGQRVEVGDPLFRIDDASYLAAQASAQAELTTAEANLPVA